VRPEIQCSLLCFCPTKLTLSNLSPPRKNAQKRRSESFFFEYVPPINPFLRKCIFQQAEEAPCLPSNVFSTRHGDPTFVRSVKWRIARITPKPWIHFDVSREAERDFNDYIFQEHRRDRAAAGFLTRIVRSKPDANKRIVPCKNPSTMNVPDAQNAESRAFRSQTTTETNCSPETQRETLVWVPRPPQNRFAQSHTALAEARRSWPTGDTNPCTDDLVPAGPVPPTPQKWNDAMTDVFYERWRTVIPPFFRC